MKFGDIFKGLPETHDSPQKQVSKDLNIASTTIGNYIRNLRQPDFDPRRLFADYFHVSVDYLLNHHPQAHPSRPEEKLLHIFRKLDNNQKQIYIKQGIDFLSTRDSASDNPTQTSLR